MNLRNLLVDLAVPTGSGLRLWQDGLGLDDESNRSILIIEQGGLNHDRLLPDVHGLCDCSYDT